MHNDSEMLASSPPSGIQKIPTQIEGLDVILHGGLPAGRVTLINGSPGTGKTVIGLEFLYRSALAGQPGIFISFEETGENIRQNSQSLGWDLKALEDSGMLFLMEGQLDPEVLISGGFNLKGFLAIIEGKAREMGARRVVIDALDFLLRIYNEPLQEQQQTLVLYNWLRKQAITAVLTAKSSKLRTNGPGPNDYLDFMADCVLYLDQRLKDQVNTKRLQVIKYRGSSYDSNECPFLISKEGLFFYSVSDMALHYPFSTKRVSSGIAVLDHILGGGYQQGSCILISGASGVGKTSIVSAFAGSATHIGEKVLYVNYEESPDEVVGNMNNIGVDLRSAVQDDLLKIESIMPEALGIEEHLYHKMTTINRFQPAHVVMDAISACKRIAGDRAAFDFIMRLVHFCKSRGITIILTNQVGNSPGDDQFSGMGVSSVIDTIITLWYKDVGAETRRQLKVVKSRGTAHSNKYHDFLITHQGVQIENADE
ncbi:MAG: circadian clock protein KaiC [Desulfatiglandaceae bacterium]